MIWKYVWQYFERFWRYLIFLRQEYKKYMGTITQSYHELYANSVARSPSPVTSVFKTVKIRGPMTRPVFLAHWVIILGCVAQFPSTAGMKWSIWVGISWKKASLSKGDWNDHTEFRVASCMHVLHFLGRAKHPVNYRKNLVKHISQTTIISHGHCKTHNHAMFNEDFLNLPTFDSPRKVLISFPSESHVVCFSPILMGTQTKPCVSVFQWTFSFQSGIQKVLLSWTVILVQKMIPGTMVSGPIKAVIWIRPSIVHLGV